MPSSAPSTKSSNSLRAKAIASELGYVIAVAVAARSRGEGYHSKYRSNRDAFRKLVTLTNAMKRAIRTYQSEQIQRFGKLIDWHSFIAGYKKTLLTDAWDHEAEMLAQLIYPYLERGAEIGFAYGQSETEKVADVSVQDPKLQKKLLKRAKDSADAITQTTKDRLKAKLSSFIDLRPATQAIKDIESIGDIIETLDAPIDIDSAIAKAIKNTMASSFRSELTADTEAIRSLMFGYEAWTGKVGATVKIWRTTEDDKVCEICAPLDGVKANIDDTFETDIGNVDAPPDPHSGCRCFMDVE